MTLALFGHIDLLSSGDVLVYRPGMPEPVDRFSLETMVMFAMTKARLPGRKLTEDDRRILAAAVADHFKLCKWDVLANPEAVPKAPEVAWHLVPPAPR